MTSSNITVKKKLCISSMVLGIVGIVFSIILPLVAYACSIPGILIGINKSKKNYNSSAGIALNIVALSLALINSLLGVVMTVKMFLGDDGKKKELQ